MTYIFVFAMHTNDRLTLLEVSTPFANVASAVSKAEELYGRAGNGWEPSGVGEHEVWYPLHHWSERHPDVSFAIITKEAEEVQMMFLRMGTRLGRKTAPSGR